MPADPVQRARKGRTSTRLRATVKQMGSHICWLCGVPIDMGLPPEHRMSWTMDHVMPVSIRPDLAEDLGNIREAHRGCNSSRGNNINYTLGPGSSRNW